MTVSFTEPAVHTDCSGSLTTLEMTGAVVSMLAISNVVVAVFPRASLTLILTVPFAVKVKLFAACQVVPPSKL